MKLMTLNGKKGYERLHFLPFNRDFKVRNPLVDSINEYGFQVPIILIRTDVITGNEELYVVDGQNRAVTAEFMDITFYAVIDDELKFDSKAALVQYVAKLNSTQVKWTPANYVYAYTYLGFPEYIKLNKYVQGCSYSLTTVATMLSGFRSKSHTPDTVMKGTFICRLTKEFEYSISVSRKASKFGRLSSKMMLGLHYVASLKSFDEVKFLKEYEKNYQCIKELKLDDYTDIFSSWIK
jgi:hypothetical protein